MGAGTKPTLFIPNTDSVFWPKENRRFNIDPSIQLYLDGSLNDTMTKYWNHFGSADAAPLPSSASMQADSVPKMSSDYINAHMFTSYNQVAYSLQQAFESLLQADATIRAQTGTSLAARLASAQQEIGNLIDKLSAQASALPDSSMDENEHILTYISANAEASAQVIGGANDAVTAAKGAADDQTALIKQLSDKIDVLNGKLTTDEQLIKTLQSTPAPSTLVSPFDASQLPGLPQNPFGPSNPNQTGLPDPNQTGLTPNPLSTASTQDNGLSGAPNLPTAGSSQVPNSSALGSMMDPMSSMLPMLMDQGLQRSQSDPGMNGPQNQLAPAPYYNVGAQPGGVGPVVPPAPGTGQPVSPATDSQTPVPADPQHNPSAAQPGGGPVTPTPGPDGSVTFNFRDGETKQVHPVVWQALTAECYGNADETNAQKAYSKTSAQWTDSKQVDTYPKPVDTALLITGDVAVFDNRMAIAVPWPEKGTLDLVVEGDRKPFASQMSDKAGDFGQFCGFVRPRGIELMGDKSANAVPADALNPADQAGAAPGSAIAAVPAG